MNNGINNGDTSVRIDNIGESFKFNFTKDDEENAK